MKRIEQLKKRIQNRLDFLNRDKPNGKWHPGDPPPAIGEDEYDILRGFTDILDDGTAAFDSEEGRATLALAHELLDRLNPGNVFEKCKIGLLRLEEAAVGSEDLTRTVQKLRGKWNIIAVQFLDISTMLNKCRLVPQEVLVLTLKRLHDGLQDRRYQQFLDVARGVEM